jgi:hypothetical protein
VVFTDFLINSTAIYIDSKIDCLLKRVEIHASFPAISKPFRDQVLTLFNPAVKLTPPPNDKV